jgi:hypothetical protein
MKRLCVLVTNLSLMLSGLCTAQPARATWTDVTVRVYDSGALSDGNRREALAKAVAAFSTMLVAVHTQSVPKRTLQATTRIVSVDGSVAERSTCAPNDPAATHLIPLRSCRSRPYGRRTSRVRVPSVVVSSLPLHTGTWHSTRGRPRL